MDDVRDSKTFQTDLGILTAKTVSPTTTYKNIITALKDDLMLEFQNRMNALDVNDSFYRLCRNDTNECYLGYMLGKAEKRLMVAATRLTASSAVADSRAADHDFKETTASSKTTRIMHSSIASTSTLLHKLE